MERSAESWSLRLSRILAVYLHGRNFDLDGHSGDKPADGVLTDGPILQGVNMAGRRLLVGGLLPASVRVRL